MRRMYHFGSCGDTAFRGREGRQLDEYNITYTGTPPDYYPSWVRIDVTNIQGTSITATLTVERLNGTSDTDSGTFDLETGVLDLLLIPAGLDA